MKCTFSQTSLFKSPTSNAFCFGEPTLGKFNQVKLYCSSTSSTFCDPTLLKLNQETEFCTMIHITSGDSVVHTGTTLSVPSSSSETSQFSVFHSNLVTTPPSSIDLTPKSVHHKDPMQHVGKNGEHFYGENWHNITKNGENSDCNLNLVT